VPLTSLFNDTSMVGRNKILGGGHTREEEQAGKAGKAGKAVIISSTSVEV
jgi:hypothetical protein